MARESESMTQDASVLIRHLLEERAEKSHAELRTLRGTLAAAIQTLEHALTPSASGDDEITDLVEQLAHAAGAESERAANEVARISAENAQLAAALAAVQQQLQAGERERDALAHELDSSNTLVDELRKAAAAHSERATKDVERIEALETALSEHGRRLSVEQLVPALEHVAGATTIADALTAVAHGLTRHFSRVAVFTVQDGHLQGMYQTGFEFGHDISKIVAPLTMDSLLAAAASSDTVQALTAEDHTGNLGVPFGGDPTCAVLFPVSMNGETHGVVYADDDADTRTDHAPMEHRVALADVVRRYAAAHIERLMASLKGVTELRGYAKWLLEEVERLYTADVSAGITGAELRMCLQDQLQCARQIHARRAELEGVADTTIFDEQIASLVNETPATPFARELQALMTNAAAASDQPEPRGAQAS